jgi:hypothetical protein
MLWSKYALEFKDANKYAFRIIKRHEQRMIRKQTSCF